MTLADLRAICASDEDAAVAKMLEGVREGEPMALRSMELLVRAGFVAGVAAGYHARQKIEIKNIEAALASIRTGF